MLTPDCVPLLLRLVMIMWCRPVWVFLGFTFALTICLIFIMLYWLFTCYLDPLDSLVFCCVGRFAIGLIVFVWTRRGVWFGLLVSFPA